MNVWPYLPVWPLLLLGSALCCTRNLYAGLSIAACLILVRSLLYFELNLEPVYLIALYSSFAFVVLFFVDRVAGGFFALVSISIALFVLGYVSHRFEMIASEVVLAMGMCASAYFGPTGGLYSRADKVSAVHHFGLGNTVAMVSRDTQAGDRGD